MHGAKVDPEDKAEGKKAIAEAKEVTDSNYLETIKAKVEALSRASFNIGQAVCDQQQGHDASEGEERKEDDGTTVDADLRKRKRNVSL